MRGEGQGSYEDILCLPHHVSARHPQMPLLDRAAQFAPFAALTGYDEAIRETARLTETLAEPDEGVRERLDQRLQRLLAEIRENPHRAPEVRVTYFQPDEKKDGGSYVSVSGKLRRVDRVQRQILFSDGTVLPMDKLFSIEGELFSDMDD